MKIKLVHQINTYLLRWLVRHCTLLFWCRVSGLLLIGTEVWWCRVLRSFTYQSLQGRCTVLDAFMVVIDVRNKLAEKCACFLFYISTCIAIHQPSTSTYTGYSLHFIFRNPYTLSASEENISSDAFFKIRCQSSLFFVGFNSIKTTVSLLNPYETHRMHSTIIVLKRCSNKKDWLYEGCDCGCGWRWIKYVHSHLPTHLTHANFKKLTSQYLMILYQNSVCNKKGLNTRACRADPDRHPVGSGSKEQSSNSRTSVPMNSHWFPGFVSISEFGLILATSTNFRSNQFPQLRNWGCGWGVSVSVKMNEIRTRTPSPTRR
jgi:hypothetical protein